MNALADSVCGTLPGQLSSDQKQAIADACSRIAPSWPLDRMIAVNPWWTLRDRTMPETAALLGALSGIRMLMPADWFRTRWQKDILARHLQAAGHCLAPEATEAELVAHLSQPEYAVRWQNVSGWMDKLQGAEHRMTWTEEIVHQISQTCAIVFQNAAPSGEDGAVAPDLYRQWLDTIRHDAGLEILMGEPGLIKAFRELPDDQDALFAQALKTLSPDSERVADYLHALLLDINGWASWVAWQEWQAGLQAKNLTPLMPQLLAIRLAWDWVIWKHAGARHAAMASTLGKHWQAQWDALPGLFHEHARQQRLRWCWQLAAELAHREALQHALREPAPAAPDTPALVQAVFCIDVRSEPMRAALEAQSDAIQTLGFAGFFGLPIAAGTRGADWLEPQLPGLLAPHIEVRENGADADAQAKALNRRARLGTMSDGPAATFSLVESLGLGYALRLARDTFFPAAAERPARLQPPEKGWLLQRAGTPLGTRETAELLARVLGAMGLTHGFAPWVLLVGHGATTRNNPHAAALNCGACGGQTGLTNARVLADLLNAPALRDELAGLGIHIPERTQFVAGLHDTVTDDIDVPAGRLPADIAGWLEQAGKQARRGRAPALGLEEADDAGLARALQRRSGDWSELRPEWGLANNAAFIAAPRAATRHLNLQGRSFLHDYDWRRDPGNDVLELIMTAPMVVANWINLQYYASVVDNTRYGSGNKMLHNVVGGHIGVFEGNGGDLRIGLPMQSVHDGRQWRHEPLRLQVYLAAPQEAILSVYERHDSVRQLVDNHWLTLFSWQPESGEIRQLLHGTWCDAAPVAAAH